MEKRVQFHYLARGVVIVDGKVLLAHQIGAGNTFLPGGHIEKRESAKQALVREIEEEIGQRARIKRFLGAIEHIWSEATKDNHEINLLFEAEIDGLTSNDGPASLDPNLEFLWAKPEELVEVDLQPSALVRLVDSGSGPFDAFWGSSLHMD
ncbi:NUDIX domain-containing protein [Candidatus Bipolaricaulota bacterium]